MSGKSPSITGTLVAMLFGPLVWAAHLLIAYGAHSSLCVAGDRLPLLSADDLPLLLWAATAIALLLTIGHAVFPGVVHRALRAGGDDRPFTGVVARTLSGLSSVAIVFAAIVIATIPLCAGLR